MIAFPPPKPAVLFCCERHISLMAARHERGRMPLEERSLVFITEKGHIKRFTSGLQEGHLVSGSRELVSKPGTLLKKSSGATAEQSSWLKKC